MGIEAILIGAAIGAGTGAGVAALTGGDVGAGAMWGAAGGGIGGAIGGAAAGGAGGLTAGQGAAIGGAMGGITASSFGAGGQPLQKGTPAVRAGVPKKTATPITQLSERERRNRQRMASLLTKGWGEPKLGKPSLIGEGFGSAGVLG